MNKINKRLLKVLLVTCDIEFFGAVKRLTADFQERRCAVKRIKSHRTALRAMKSGGYDVCLIDFDSGTATGLKLLHQAIVQGCRQPLILLTGEAENSFHIEAMRTGAACCLTKEKIDAPLLEQAIGYAVERVGSLTKLREKMDKFRNLVETLPVMIYAAEPQPPYSPIYISPAFETFGYSLKEWNSRPDLWVSLLHPEDSERILRETEAMMNAGLETDLEYRVIAEDGAVHWVHDRGHFVRDDKGKLICWQGVILDITTRKRAEEEAKQREKLYLTLAQSIPHTSVLIFDKDLRYNIAEISADNNYGLTREQIEGKTLWEIFPPEVCAEWSELYNRALAGETVSTEKEARGKFFQAYVVPVKNECGEIFAGMVLWQDITERKKSEKALRESEARYRDIFENANDLIYVHDLKGNYLSINKATERIIGYTLEEALQLNMRQVVAPEHLNYSRRRLAEKLADEAQQTVYETDCLTKDGRRVTLEINSSPVYKDGVPVAVQGIARDITERKLIEQRILQSEAQMQAVFAAMTDTVMVFDADGIYLKITHGNPQLSYEPTIDLVGKKLHEIFPESLADLFSAGIKKSLSGQKSVKIEYSLKTGDEECWFAAVVSPMTTNSAVVVIRDISESKRAEKALKEREEQYRELFENANDLIYTRDLNGRFTSFNRAGEIITGYTREEILGMNSEEVITPDYLKKAQAMIARENVDEPSPFYELVIISKQGERIPLEISTRLIMKDGVPVGIQGIARDITERKRAERLLQINEAKLKDLFDNAPLGYHELDREGRVVRVNRTELEMLGYTSDEMLGHFIWEFVVESVSRGAVLGKLSGNAILEPHERTFRRKDGSEIPILIQERLIKDADGSITGIRSTLQDITEQRRAEKAIVDSEQRYRSLGEGIMHQVWTAQPNGKIDYVNGRTLNFFGRTFEQMVGQGWQALVHPEDLPKAIKRWSHSIETSEDYETEFRLKRHNGEYCWHQARATAEFGADGTVISWFGTNTDINDLKAAEAKLQHIAGHDTLTNLPNRTKFMNHLARAVSRSEHNSSFCFAVLFLDLDRFKVINDSLGHNIGDKLLIAFAKKLEECLRPNDIVARLGGDEFTILLCGITDSAAAVRVAERILEKLSVPFMLDAYEVFTSASIGIIVSDKVERQPEDFLRDADTAMYRAKAAGKSRYEIFDREMHLRNMNLLQMENDLRRAIERDEFRVFYQPIIELATGEIREFEALIRWQHSRHGLIPPNEFITIAEETGLIIPIGRWILEEAARQTAEWQKRFPFHKNLSISVNLSAKQLMHPTLTAQVGEILEKTALDSRCLKLEVTESMVMENSDQALTVISELTKLGIRLSTDDFGTGYSSLSYLHRFPFNRLKIDRSFVSKMDSDQKSEAIVRTILLLAQNLNIEVVAEGIETESQLKSLRQLGCKTGQGYFFSKPVTADVAAQLLQNGLQNNTAESFYGFGESENHQLLELDKVQ